MKIWGIICLFGVTSGLNAHNIEKSEVLEERAVVSAPAHLEEEGLQKTSSKDHKTDPSSIVKESNENYVASQDEKPEPYVIVVTDKVSPPGGGVPTLDPKLVNEMALPPFSETKAPWWERWWVGLTGFFLSDTLYDAEVHNIKQKKFIERP